MKRLFILCLSLIFLFQFCSLNKNGNFQIYLTDQPIPIEDVDNLNVTISDVKVHKTEEGFLNVAIEQDQFDLIELQDIEKIFVDTELEKGSYTQIRLIVNSGKIVINEEPHDMTIPNSEIIIPVVFDVLKGRTTEIILDFDAEESISVVEAGITGQYILRPVITVKSVSY